MNEEESRLHGPAEEKTAWKKWGPYLSERQWGTVREDYSDSGNPWDYFTHDQARSRAYRWGEDGLGGICDDKQRLCFALALWNGVDPILKERLFGLTNAEGNHGEDVKEYYFYLDSTPTHSYMKYLYKYPQSPYPYQDLLDTNRRRTRNDLEYELLDTGAFNEDRYFDVYLEYAKAAPEDILIRITVFNRGPDEAMLDVLPTLWFRNTWTWNAGAPKPSLRQVPVAERVSGIVAAHADLGRYVLFCSGGVQLLFTENESNHQRLFGTANPAPYVKDGFHDYLVHGRSDAVNPTEHGTKAAAHYVLSIPPRGSSVVRLRLTKEASGAAAADPFGKEFDRTIAARKLEADAYYEAITPPGLDADARNVMRQALAGMLWSKQYYCFDVERWLAEHASHPPGAVKLATLRNRHWLHMRGQDIISMPDKWEYPWSAAWDLAFHTVALNLVDPEFARAQLNLLLSSNYLHPNGQIPANEWNFGDVDPPVHAWATLLSYHALKQRGVETDIEFLEQAFQKLLLNFTWWMNRKDPSGRDIFEGGFLGLDYVGVFDRRTEPPGGRGLEQADGIAWMTLYAQNMLEIALELCAHDSAYEDMVLRFVEHLFRLAAAVDRIGENAESMWDEEDGFFYDVLRLPDATGTRIKVRSMVGLLPVCAATVLPADIDERCPLLLAHARALLERHPESSAVLTPPGERGRRILALVGEHKLRRILARMLDEAEFLGPYGIRSLSRAHLDQPWVFAVQDAAFKVEYLPAESDSAMFGGNANWRGPVWMPLNLLLVRALYQYHLYYGDDFKIECPTGSGNALTLFEVARHISDRLARTFLCDEAGRRPVFGATEKFQSDPHWRDHLLFYEYFHGDNGAGLGASHQTGWTGAVAKLIQMSGCGSAKQLHGGATGFMADSYGRD